RGGRVGDGREVGGVQAKDTGGGGAGPAAERELAAVNKEDFVVVDVAVVPGDPQCFGVTFQRAWGKSANDKTLRFKGAVRAGREMNAFAHQRPEVLHVQFEDGLSAFPTHDIQWAEVIEH